MVIGGQRLPRSDIARLVNRPDGSALVMFLDQNGRFGHENGGDQQMPTASAGVRCAGSGF